ncbi:MAG: hypothetical protein KY395_06700 [Actinobacteria bacterium]|nr:hypothetical protein [Actinomycetota bacterium]
MIATVPKTDVLLLGTHHLDNPGLDMANVVVDDVLSDHRQAELASVAADLAKFAPTKVLVEQEVERNSALAGRYESYLRDDQFSLRRGEEEQIGFRVAAQCGLPGVVGIDVQDKFWEPRIDELAATDPEVARRMADLHAYGEAETKEEQELLATSTLGSVLLAKNTQAALAEDLRVYMTFFVPIIGDGYPGADVVANWYRRNLKIFANLLRIPTRRRPPGANPAPNSVPARRHVAPQPERATLGES